MQRRLSRKVAFICARINKACLAKRGRQSGYHFLELVHVGTSTNAANESHTVEEGHICNNQVIGEQVGIRSPPECRTRNIYKPAIHPSPSRKESGQSRVSTHYRSPPGCFQRKWSSCEPITASQPRKELLCNQERTRSWHNAVMLVYASGREREGPLYILELDIFHIHFHLLPSHVDHLLLCIREGRVGICAYHEWEAKARNKQARPR